MSDKKQNTLSGAVAAKYDLVKIPPTKVVLPVKYGGGKLEVDFRTMTLEMADKLVATYADFPYLVKKGSTPAAAPAAKN